MQLTQTRFILIATLGLVVLGGCNSGNQTPTTTSSPAVTSASESKPAASASPVASAEKPAPAKTDSHGGQGGQVIESGPYHLELVTLNEVNSTHIDFFLQKGDNHDPIPNAKVTAQVQLPDGSQQSLDMKYDASGKHYVAVLPGSATGNYNIAILSNINGEKVNARYQFKR